MHLHKPMFLEHLIYKKLLENLPNNYKQEFKNARFRQISNDEIKSI